MKNFFKHSDGDWAIGRIVSAIILTSLLIFCISTVGEIGSCEPYTFGDSVGAWFMILFFWGMGYFSNTD